MRTTLLALGLLLLPHIVSAAELPSASLFFTDEETKQIHVLEAKTANHADTSDIHLGAVLYYGPDNWTLWLQGKRWTPETKFADMRVISVQPGLVRIGLPETADVPVHEIALKPHQTYQMASGKIIEGTR